MEGVGAAAGGVEIGCSQAQSVILVPDSVSDAKLAEVAKSIAEIEAAFDGIHAIDRSWILISVNLEIGLFGVDVRCHEPLSKRSEGAIELGLDPVGLAELQIGAPFGTVAPDVHGGDTRRQSEVDVLRLAAVNLYRRQQEGRSISLFMDANQQTCLAIVVYHVVGDAVIAPNAGKAGQQIVECFRIQRLPDELVKKLLNILCTKRICAFHADKLRNARGDPEAGLFLLEVVCPTRIIQRIRFQDLRLGLRGLVALL